MKSSHHIFILVLFLIFSYSNTLNSAFVLDDNSAILENEPLHIKEVSIRSISNLIISATSNRRFVANLTFGFNHLIDGFNPVGYHIVNIFIHIITTILVYFVFIEIFTPLNLSLQPETTAFLTAGLWGLNPLQTQAVTYIVQRMTSMCTMFFMASFYLYIQARKDTNKRQKTIFLFSLACWLLALFSKEIAITLPVIILFYEYCFKPETLTKRRIAYISTIWVVTISFFIVTWYLITDYTNPNDFLFNIFNHKHTESFDKKLTTYQRLLTELRVVFHYISLYLLPLPSRLMVLYDFPISESLFKPLTTLFSLLSCTVLFIYALLKRNHPLVSFSIFWYFVNLLLESTFLKLHLVFEHRAYLPSIGIAALLAYGFTLIIKSVNYKQHFQNSILILFVLLATLTYNRNNVWANPITLYEDNFSKVKTSTILAYNLGQAYDMVGWKRKALMQYNIATKISDQNYKAYYNIGILYRNDKKFTKAIEFFIKAKNISTKNAVIMVNLGYSYLNIGKNKKAVEALKKAVSLDTGELVKSGFTPPGIMLSDIYIKNKLFKKANDALLATYNSMENPEILFRLGIINIKLNNVDKSKVFFKRFIDKADSDDKRRIKAKEFIKMQAHS